MAEQPRIIASRECDMFSVDLRDDGILEYRPLAGATLTHETALQVLELGLQIAEGRPRPILVHMQDIGRVDHAARSFFASEEYLRLACGTALVVKSPVSRVIGHFFVGLNRLKYPCRVFEDVQLAVTWLRAFAT